LKFNIKANIEVIMWPLWGQYNIQHQIKHITTSLRSKHLSLICLI